MNRRTAIQRMATFLLITISDAQAQQTGKIRPIGFLTGTPLSALKPRTNALRMGLRELGYVEGKNLKIEWRSVEGSRDPQRYSSLALELVQLKVEVIVTASAASTRAAKAATSTIPIVMAQDSDPIGNGFIASLARPGRNITGLSSLSTDLVGKRLELLKEAVPKLSQLAIIGTSDNQENYREAKEVENIAAAFGVKVQYLDVRAAKGLDTAFQAAAKARANGVFWLVSGSIGLANLKQISELFAKHRLPAIFDNSDYVDGGGLMSYGVSLTDLYRRAATYVDKLLNGANPAEPPVEQPIKFDFVVNRKAAKQIGLTIPPNLLVRATRVIK